MTELKDVRIQLLLSKSEAEAIDEWRFSHRIGSRNEAIRRLVELGMTVDDTLAMLSARAFALSTTDDLPEHVEDELEAIANALDELRKRL